MFLCLLYCPVSEAPQGENASCFQTIPNGLTASKTISQTARPAKHSRLRGSRSPEYAVVRVRGKMKANQLPSETAMSGKRCQVS